MVPLSKSGGQQCLVGSNPTLSAKVELDEKERDKKDMGEVLEWPIRRAWRARVALATVGSNPTLSAKVEQASIL